jgi:hypothetical protein
MKLAVAGKGGAGETTFDATASLTEPVPELLDRHALTGPDGVGRPAEASGGDR